MTVAHLIEKYSVEDLPSRAAARANLELFASDLLKSLKSETVCLLDYDGKLFVAVELTLIDEALADLC